MKIRVQKTKDAITPRFAHDTDSGFDFFTSEDITIEAGKKAIVPTGLRLELPFGWGVQIKNKSGITVKGCPINEVELKEVVAECDNGIDKLYKLHSVYRADITVFEGTIDMTYRGEIGIMVKNEEPFEITIPKHTKIAQGLLRQVYSCEFEEVEEINLDTDRGEGGYGSTGTQA